MAAQICPCLYTTHIRSASDPRCGANSAHSYDCVILQHTDDATKSFHRWRSVIIRASIYIPLNLTRSCPWRLVSIPPLFSAWLVISLMVMVILPSKAL